MELSAKKRTVLGKKVKASRREGKLPAVLYGGDKPSVPLFLNKTVFEKIYSQAGESTVINLALSGKKQDILISDTQVDPLGKIIHADLRRVIAGEKITATVQIIVEGESTAVKSGEGILLILLDEVEVEAYPKDLPADIKIDISELTEVGQVVEVKDLPIDHEKVEVLEQEPDAPVVKIDYPQEEEEEEKEEAEISEEEAIAAVEAVEEKPEEEGDEPPQKEQKQKEEEPQPKEGK